MSGIIMLCGQQQFDAQDNPLNGGQIYMLQAGTLTPQNGFKDAALVNPYTNPIVLDSTGRVPLIYFADGLIRVRITDINGVLMFDFDNIPVLGQSGGTSIVDTSDASARLATADIKARYGSGSLAGWVRANGGSIGNINSPATERANPDCQNLFMYLWNLNDPDLPVSPSRGTSAAADWAATAPWKTVALPDFRGCFLGAVDGMGQANTGRLSTNNFTGTKDQTTLGAFAGFEFFQLTGSHLPTHNHGIVENTTHVHSINFTSQSENANHTHNVTVGGNTGTSNNSLDHQHTGVPATAGFAVAPGAVGAPSPGPTNTGGIAGGSPAIDHTHSWGGTFGSGIESTVHQHQIIGNTNPGFTGGFTIQNAGSGLNKYVVPPVRLVTFYIKL
jgi:hypothetical protein